MMLQFSIKAGFDHTVSVHCKSTQVTRKWHLIVSTIFGSATGDHEPTPKHAKSLCAIFVWLFTDLCNFARTPEEHI